MSATNPLDSVYFITLPQDAPLKTAGVLRLDSSIPLPVQKKEGDDDAPLNTAALSEEQLLSGLLKVLAYDGANPHLEYYRSLLVQVRPNIKTELAEAAILKTKNEDWDLAEEIWQALHGLAPQDPAITLNRALFFDQRADSYRKNELHVDADAYDAQALECYRQAMDYDPEIPDAFFNAGFFYLKLRDFGEAKSAFENYLGLTVDAKDEDLGENGLYKKRRAQEIVENIKNRDLESDLFRDAYHFISTGQEEKGLDKIRQFLQKNPAVWNAWFLLGWGLRRIERFADARLAFEKALECDGGMESADTLNELAICQMETGDFDGARDSLGDALSIDPENTKVISNLGYVALKAGKTEEARGYFATVLEIDPTDKIAAAQLEQLEHED